jgi:phage tail-like protein
MTDEGKISSYLFAVEIDGIETARFQKCEGLEAETCVCEVEEGGLNTGAHKFYGAARYPNLVLEKGITENEALFTWYRETILEDKETERKNGSVILKDAENKERKRWNFFRAFPCRWIGPKLEGSMGSDYALERIEIAHEGLIVEGN